MRFDTENDGKRDARPAIRRTAWWIRRVVRAECNGWTGTMRLLQCPALAGTLVKGTLMKLIVLVISLVSWTALAVELPRSVFDPMSYGAKGDGIANDGAAIQKAIDACTQAGGGMVYLPPGNFLTGTIVLKSNVTLHLSAGATLWGSRHIEDYKPFHLIYAENADNIAIEGDGTINGNGDAFWGREFRPIEKRPSPFIELVGCHNVHIRDVRIRNTPGWGIRPWNCDGVYIRGISMISDMDSPNTDGIDPDASRNVFISDSYIETGDDAICL
jgi:polygalacturonase